MEEINTNIEEIDKEIQTLKIKKKKIKQKEKRNIRLSSNNSGKPNDHTRVSMNFKHKLDYINSKREENGLDSLSNPKITELMITHLECSPIIEDAIIHYNNNLDVKEEEREFNGQ